MARGALLQGRAAAGLTVGSPRARAAVVAPLIAAVGLTACSRPRSVGAPVPSRGGAAAEGDFAAPADLTATLIDPSNVLLRWRPDARESIGYWIEFATPGADFVKLDAAWPRTTTSFRHPDVAPGTTFIYRLVPFFGPVSNVVAVRTGPALRPAPPSAAEGPLEEPRGGGRANDRRGQTSLRTTATIADAAPTGLAVKLASPSSVELRWEDRATDEDGYLVELAQGGRDFQVCALLPPDVTSFRKVALPPDTQLQFRVRAFFEGTPTPLVSVATPVEAAPAGGPVRR
jgi:hypothetical protein